MFNVQLSCKFKPTTGQCAGLIRNTTTLRIKFIQNTECLSWEVHHLTCKAAHCAEEDMKLDGRTCSVQNTAQCGGENANCTLAPCPRQTFPYMSKHQLHLEVGGGGYKKALKVVGVHTNMLHPLKI